MESFKYSFLIFIEWEFFAMVYSWAYVMLYYMSDGSDYYFF